jgi:hypothetical protein
MFFFSIFQVPFQIGLCFYFIFMYLDYSAITGLFCIVIMWLLSYFLQKIKRIYRIRKDKFKSMRLKQIDDLFSAIKV